MAKKYYVYSKMAAGVSYNKYSGGGDTLRKIVHSITVKGGAGVANKNIITPMGVRTEITAEDRDELLQNKVFQKHMRAGFVTIEEHAQDPDKVATNLTEGPDPSAPLTPADFDTENPELTAVPTAAKRRGRPAKQ